MRMSIRILETIVRFAKSRLTSVRTRRRDGGCKSGGMLEGDGEGGLCVWMVVWRRDFSLWPSWAGYQRGLKVMYMIH